MSLLIPVNINGTETSYQLTVQGTNSYHFVLSPGQAPNGQILPESLTLTKTQNGWNSEPPISNELVQQLTRDIQESENSFTVKKEQ